MKTNITLVDNTEISINSIFEDANEIRKIYDNKIKDLLKSAGMSTDETKINVLEMNKEIYTRYDLLYDARRDLQTLTKQLMLLID